MTYRTNDSPLAAVVSLENMMGGGCSVKNPAMAMATDISLAWLRGEAFKDPPPIVHPLLDL